MAKFINIDNDTIININEIEGIQRELFDMGVSDFIAEGAFGEIVDLECRTLLLANIRFIGGKTLGVRTTIYSDQDYVEQINRNWESLIKHLDSRLVNL